MFTARGIHCLSSSAPELALELFNLVRATPRAAIGQLESTRRATFLGARFPSCLRRCSLGFSPSAVSAVAASDSSANREERGQLRRELRRGQRGQRLVIGSAAVYGLTTMRKREVERNLPRGEPLDP